MVIRCHGRLEISSGNNSSCHGEVVKGRLEDKADVLLV